MDVLLKKGDKEGTVVAFVIGGLGKDDALATEFKKLGEVIATNGFGKPMPIRLIDTHLNTLKDIKLE